MGGLLVSLLPWRHAAPLSTAGRGRAHTTQARLHLLAGTAGLALVALGCRYLRRVEVRGPSMLPAFVEGDRLLVGPPGRLAVGDVVVVREPGAEGLLAVKRVGALLDEGVVVLGDNAAMSRDSRAYGPVPRRAVLGRVWWCYHPPERVGRRGRGRAGHRHRRARQALVA